MSLLEHLTIGSTRDVVILVLLSLTSCSVRGQTQQVNCELPGIDFESQRIDVLGDFEKTQICKLPRPESLCPRVGPADFACRAIARAVGGVRNVSCAYPNTCAFQVKVPVQHPSRPGFAFVSLCTPKFAGVIFPCRENSLVIANPFFKGAYVNDDPPPDVDPGEDAEDEGGRTVGQGNIASNPHCEFPPLDEDARAVDVLGDREKANICSLPRPLQLCNRGKGDADEFCRKIARSVGGTSDAKCLRRNICSFNVKKPVQRPDDPGLAYVSLCVPDGAGVIFPCRVNNLVVIDPYFDDIIDTEGGPKEPPPNWSEVPPSSWWYNQWRELPSTSEPPHIWYRNRQPWVSPSTEPPRIWYRNSQPWVSNQRQQPPPYRPYYNFNQWKQG